MLSQDSRALPGVNKPLDLIGQIFPKAPQTWAGNFCSLEQSECLGEARTEGILGLESRRDHLTVAIRVEKLCHSTFRSDFGRPRPTDLRWSLRGCDSWPARQPPTPHPPPPHPRFHGFARMPTVNYRNHFDSMCRAIGVRIGTFFLSFRSPSTLEALGPSCLQAAALVDPR